MTTSDVAMESPVVASVRQWLREHGAPLEMRCAHAFHEAGAEVVQSEYYLSRQGKMREIDVTGHLSTSWTVQPLDGEDDRHFQKMIFDLCVVVECKSGPLSQKPWIVFSSAGAHLPFKARFQRLGTTGAKHVIVEAALDQKVFELDLFKVGDRPGYALGCAFKPDNKNAEAYDPAFNALSSVTAAALAKTNVEKLDTKWPTKICRLVLPVILVDTPIVECWLDDTGAMQLRESSRAAILWRNPIADEPMVIVDLVHESALETYVDQARIALSVLSDYRPLIEDMEAAAESAR